MKTKNTLNKPALERIRQRAANDDKVLRDRLDNEIASFKQHLKEQREAQQKKWSHVRWPYTLEIVGEEIDRLIAYLFQLRAGETSTWMRGPFITAPCGGEIKIGLPTGSDGEPANAGEEFASLLRKYWQLAFGYTDARKSQRKGIASLIFAANEIDPLDVALQIGEFKGKPLAEIASDLKPLLTTVGRSLAPSDETRKETLRQRVRDMSRRK